MLAAGARLRDAVSTAAQAHSVVQHLPLGAAASLTGRSLAQCRPRLVTTTAAAAQAGWAQLGGGAGLAAARLEHGAAMMHSSTVIALTCRANNTC